MTTTYRLSIEEVAFALGAVGGTDAAAGFLLSVIGRRSAEDTQARLAAASHSLVARALLQLPDANDDGAGQTLLEPTLRRVAEHMMRGDDVIRISVTGAGAEGERVVAFFRAADGEAVRHEMVPGGVSELAVIDDPAAVAAAVAELAAPAGLSAVEDAAIGRIPVQALHAARSRTQGVEPMGVAELAPVLADLPAAAAPAVATTMCATDATWVATLRIITGEGGKAEANHGFFVVHAADAGWLFDMTGRCVGAGDAHAALIYPLTRRTALAAAVRLLADA